MVEGNQETHHGTRVVRKPPEDVGSQETVERGPTPQGERTPAERDHGTYHGVGFSGKRLGKPPPAQQLETQTSAGRQAGAPQAAPPVMYCYSCQGQAEWLPNGQLWCSRCQTAIEVEDRTKQAGAAVGGVILGIAMLLFALGAFDPILAQYFGFSLHDCMGYYNFAGQLVGVECYGPLGWSTGVTQP